MVASASNGTSDSNGAAGSNGAAQREFKFIRGSECSDTKCEWPKDAVKVRKKLGEALNSQNVSFLLGAGCSSACKNGKELGISTMKNLAIEFTKTRKNNGGTFPTTAERETLQKQFGVDLGCDKYSKNLENLMGVMFSLQFSLTQSSLECAAGQLETVNSVIEKAKKFLCKKCTEGNFSEEDNAVMKSYLSFYRKLVLRDRSLPRPWVFTTNYDLFNETAMDRLGLQYTNGFSGVVERYFNPATFRYALAEQLDLTTRKWSAVDGFVYLCKLHGSISWTNSDHGLFPIRETATVENPGDVMIYPTPAKQTSSLGSPYTDLFREFQSRVVREQSVLFTIGYSFGDEHINNIIYQALSIPTFRLIIFTDPCLQDEFEKLHNLNDPRIWFIGGGGPEEGRKAHYFDTFVDEFMPQRPNERIDKAIKKLLSSELRNVRREK